MSAGGEATVPATDDTSGTKTLVSAQKMLVVLEIVASAAQPTVSEVAKSLGWSRGVAHQYLVTGIRSGWLVRDGDTYVLSTKACAIGNAASAAVGLTVAVRAEMAKLVKAIHEPISFAVLDGDGARIVDRVEPDRALQVRRTSEERMSVKTSASGQVILAHQDAHTRARMRMQGVDLLDDAFYRQIRLDGYAEIQGQWGGDDVTAVAVPVFTTGKCHGALSAICPSGRTDPDLMRSHLCASRDLIHSESRFDHDD